MAKRLNIITAFVCLFLVLSAVFPWANLSVGWGDDQAAYISDAIALAEGSYDEKTLLNVLMHPSVLQEEDLRHERRVYVWGYPLIQSLIYRIVGFDRVDYHTVTYYHIPGVVCISLLSVVMFLWFRRHFCLSISLALSVFFCVNGQIVQTLQTLYSDIVFLFFAVLCFYLSELQTCRIKDKNCSWLFSCIFGIVMWYCSEVRANGTMIIAVLALGHAVLLFSSDNRSRFMAVLPYVLAFSLKAFFENFILYPPTSDIGQTVLGQPGLFFKNIRLYWNLLQQWFADFPFVPGYLFPSFCKLLCIAFLLLLFLGAFISIKENFHYFALIIGTFLMLFSLAYDQGTRYFFPVLPLMLLFAAKGLSWLVRKIRIIPKCIYSARTQNLISVMVLCICILASYNTFSDGMQIKNSDVKGAYSENAVDMYNYIQKNLPEDCVIAFRKPRFLYLNTERLSFVPLQNGHDITLADYLLYDRIHSIDYEKILQIDMVLEVVYDNF